MESIGSAHLQFPLASSLGDDYPPLDDAGMDSDLASDDGRSSASLAGSTYEIVSNHPDQDFDHAEESDFTAPDDTHSIDDGSEASAFEVTIHPHTLQDRVVETDTMAPQSPLFASTLTPSDDDVDIGNSATTSGTVVLPLTASADESEPAYHFPSAPIPTGTEIKLPQASLPLELGRSLRIAYHGPDSYKDEILDKIAQAVASSINVDNNTDTREDGYDHYQIISLPSGASEATVTSSQDLMSNLASDVALVPASGIEVAVQICDLCSDPGMEQRRAGCRAPSNRSSACPDGHGVGWKSRNLHSAGKRTTCKDTCHQHGFCKLHRMYERERADAKARPDLAIFFHPAGQYTPGASVCSSSCSYVCSANTSLAGVPVLDISEDARFSVVDSPIFKPSMGLAAHMIEHQLVSSGSVTKPLDLQAFLALDNASLNRHIALLTHARNSGFGYMLPDFSDLKQRAWSSLRPLRASNISTPILSTFACLGSLLAVFVIARLMQPVYTTAPVPLCSKPALNIRAHVLGEDSLGFRMPKTHPKIMTSTEMGLSITTEIPLLAPRKPSRQEVKEREEVVMTLPKELANMRYPPKVFASATQEGKDVKVSIVKINGSAIKVDLEPPYSDYPVEVMVWTESKPRFKRALTCNVKQNSLQKWSMDTLVSSLFGTNAAKWASLAISEMDLLRVTTERWLRHAIGQLQNLTSIAQNQSLQALQTATGLLKHYSLQTESRYLERAYSGKDGACVRQLLANSRRLPFPVAEFQCMLLRRTREASETWDASKQQIQTRYLSLARNTQNSYRALQKRSQSSFEVWQKDSLARVESWKRRAEAMHGIGSRKVHERFLKLTDKAKRRANKVRSKAGRGGRRQRRRA